MIWLVLGWVLVGLFILAIEGGWLSIGGSLIGKDRTPNQQEWGSVVLFMWVIVHVIALGIGGWLLVRYGLSQMG
ncbi:membrane protein [Gordonia phage Dre3]|uniref:Uncharacterized protein n=1 Tax=Gordonia phage Gibbous TaxID=2652405 RepID=A0A5J6T4I1_9CAUD|nr:hypothetical protein QLQ74_gp67 [Gordonia phage Gibbous]QFG05143.1 hypothetical protein SEA_GIBBOUS_67 [Gordonia phage Gibbous]QRI45996.1 membrane protein [Gordonia phage Dre3]